MTVDTLDYAKKLEAAGVERRQAEAHAEALRDAVVPQLVSKPDLNEARTDLRNEIAKVRSDLKSEIDLLRTEFTGKFTLLYGMVGFNIAATMAVLWRLLR